MTLKTSEAKRIAAAHRSVLEWFAERARPFPWRDTSDPYRILVAEVMLQQTQTARVGPIYESFLHRFPTIERLAMAPAGAVIRAWSGLGYNRRAIALHSTARAVVREHAGELPADPKALRGLPGIGGYTANAVACFAFGAEVPVVDVNVRRVLSRAAIGSEPADVRPVVIDSLAQTWLHTGDAYTWNQALMDVGATLCRSGVPQCAECPLAPACAYRSAGSQLTTSAQAKKKPAERFEGSSRQVRGAIVERLRHAAKDGITLGELRTVYPSVERLAELLSRLEAEGLVVLSPAARRGSPRGSVRLP